MKRNALLLILAAALLLAGCGKKASVDVYTPLAELTVGSAAEYQTEEGFMLRCTLESVLIESRTYNEQPQKQERITLRVAFDSLPDNLFGDEVGTVSVLLRFSFFSAGGDKLGEMELRTSLGPEAVEVTQQDFVRYAEYGDQVASVTMAVAGAEALSPVEPSPEVKTGLPLFEFYQREDMLAFRDGFYADPPVSMWLRYDNQQYPEAEITDSDTIAAVFEALKSITVTGATDRSVTDSYHHAAFVMADGREIHFSFEGGWLNYGGRNYELSGAESFWTLLRATVEAAAEA